MAELNPKHIEALLKLINRGPYFKHLSMVVKDMGVGYSVAELTIGKEHMNPFGGIHGGVYASVIDTAAYWAVYGELDEDAGYITIDLKLDLLAPATAGKIVVKGKRIRIGKTICLAEAGAFDPMNRCLAHGSSKVMVTPGLQTIRNVVNFTGKKSLPPKFI